MRRATEVVSPSSRTPSGRAHTDADPESAAKLRGRLSREGIVASAIGYVGRHCLADLSMRRLGSELGVEAMSLYRYFPSKAALFDALVDVALRQVTSQVGDPSDWESGARAYARAFRKVALAQPRLFPLLAAADRDHTGVRVLGERMMAMWRRAGLDESTARFAQCALHGFTMGVISGEVGVSYGKRFDPPRRTDRSNGAGGSNGATDGVPRAGSMLPAVDPPSESEFEFSVGVLIEGLRDQFAARQREASHSGS
jgi:AcrR family transcriptional regulator